VILNSQSNLNTPPVFAAIVLLAVMSIVFFHALVALERLLVPWSEHVRNEQ
jgi:ABC-type nitrate/sulfonate/bicarbonate transport system permease component